VTARTLVRAGLVVTAAFLISRVLGWVRLIVITASVDTPDLDPFFAAYRIPDLMFQVVAAGALSSALIPVVSGLLATDEDQRAWRLVSTVANGMLIALLGLAVAFALAAPIVVPAITPGFDAVATAETVELTRVMLLSPILLALGAVATSALNARGRFGPSAVAPIVYNLSIIGAAVLLAPSMGVMGLAVGVVAGSACHLLVQLRPLRDAGFRYLPVADLGDSDTRRTLALLAPRALGLGASQVTFLVATTLASSQTGGITAFTVAFALLQLPIGVIGVPLGVVLLPSMSREMALGGATEYVRLITRSVRLLLFVMLPIAALGMVLRRDIVILLFGHGQFTPRDIQLTADTLFAFLAGLPAHAAIAILARAFYARQDTRTPVAAAILAVLINSSLAVVLMGPLGLPGLALGIAVAAWIEALVLLGLLHRRVVGLELVGLGRVLLEAGVGSAAAAGAALFVVRLVQPVTSSADLDKLVVLFEAVAATAAGGLAFLAVALALRIPELPSIVSVMVDLVRRRGRP
jgi:putative peptidoglycan lipid II flippase